MSADSEALAGWLPGHDARWVIATVLVVAGLLWMKTDALERRFADLRTDVRRIDDRLRAVEIALGRVETRLRFVENRLDAVENRLDAVENTLRTHDDRLRAVEAAVVPAAPAPGE